MQTRSAPTRRPDDVNVLALVKGAERYVVLYQDNQQKDALRQLGRWASNADLAFNWYDAATLSHRVRNGSPEQR